MVSKLLYPQEVEVYYILPALRRELTLELKRQGMEQKKIAEILGVTGAAISQYVHSKRASEIDLTKIKKEIIEAAKKITDRYSVLKVTQNLLKLSLDKGITCDKCQMEPSCTACF